MDHCEAISFRRVRSVSRENDRFFREQCFIQSPPLSRGDPVSAPVLLAKSAERLTRPFATKRGARGGSIGRGRIKFYRFVGKKEESNADNVDSIACLQCARITIGFLYERERERERKVTESGEKIAKIQGRDIS